MYIEQSNLKSTRTLLIASFNIDWSCLWHLNTLIIFKIKVLEVFADNEVSTDHRLRTVELDY